MSQDSPLPRAHALSAQASALLRPPSATTSPSILNQALRAYKEATTLFEQSHQTSQDDTTRKTLLLLTNQHKKLVRDLERKISALPDPNITPTPSVPAPTLAPAERIESPRRVSEPVIPASEGRKGGMGIGIGIGSAAGRGWTANPGIASRLSPPGGAGSGRGILPFALGPGLGPSAIPPSVSNPDQNPNHNPSSTKPISPFSASSSRPPLSQRQTGPGQGQPIDTSPLYSSSSSSELIPDDSYINFGAIPETLDPFSRFWGMLENMLDDISNPVAFASAPIGGVSAGMASDGRIGKGDGAGSAAGKGKRKDKSEKRLSDTSPIGSYYVVQKSKVPSNEDISETGGASRSGRTGSTSASGKTPEELALENENLRASLDALALHTESVDQANKLLREQAEDRERMMRDLVKGVRQEARKAKHGQDLLRSQLLGTSVSSNSPWPSPGSASTKEDATLALRKRIRELEEEVRSLTSENEKQRLHVQKYRDKFDKIKVNARAKRDAKDAKGDNKPPDDEG